MRRLQSRLRPQGTPGAPSQAGARSRPPGRRRGETLLLLGVRQDLHEARTSEAASADTRAGAAAEFTGYGGTHWTVRWTGRGGTAVLLC